MRYRYVQSMLKGVNELVGGIPTRSIMGIFGTAESGKTILAFHLIYDKLIEDKENKSSALIFDTEGSEYTYIEWLEVLNERHNVDVGLKWADYDPETLKVNISDDGKTHDKYIFVLDIRTIEHILSFHGRGCSVTTSKTRHTREGEVKGGKFDLKPENRLWVSLWESPVGKFIEEHNIGMIVYDSITNPLTEFGFQQENLPARSNCTSWWLTKIQELSQLLDLVVIAILHETGNPQKEWERPSHEGGKAIDHNLKFIIYISAGKSKRTPKTPTSDTDWNPTTRELRNARHPSRRPFETYVKLDLTNNGFIDLEV